MDESKLRLEIEELEIDMNDDQFARLLDWLRSPYDAIALSNDPDAWYYPTKLSVIAQLAIENNLPPRFLAPYKEWLSRTGWKDQHSVDSNGFLVWNGID